MPPCREAGACPWLEGSSCWAANWAGRKGWQKIKQAPKHLLNSEINLSRKSLTPLPPGITYRSPTAKNNLDKHLDWVSPRHLSANKVFTLTLSNSGGGLFPLHKFDKAQTAFRVIVNLVDLVRSLKRQLPWVIILDVEASKEKPVWF